MSIRRKGREIVMQAIYQYQIRGGDLQDILAFDWLHGKTHHSILEFAKHHLEGTVENLEQVDALLASFSHNWDQERIGNVERAILRMSSFSLQYCPDIPSEVVIDEAVFLAKKYCDDKSYKFINGVLDGIAVSISKDKKANLAADRGLTEKV